MTYQWWSSVNRVKCSYIWKSEISPISLNVNIRREMNNVIKAKLDLATYNHGSSLSSSKTPIPHSHWAKLSGSRSRWLSGSSYGSQSKRCTNFHRTLLVQNKRQSHNCVHCSVLVWWSRNCNHLDWNIKIVIQIKCSQGKIYWSKLRSRSRSR